ncbi:PadR family transcriptional regulator [Archaeoglobales archaeon]|nr:MAG: PadR family transcriptional regulator [Archaeoglobales archaeon]
MYNVKERVEKAMKKLKKELRSGIYSYLVLSFLHKNRKMHGYAIRKEFERVSNGKVVPSEGALYDILKSLQKLKLIKGEWVEAGGRLRRCYEITSFGKQVLEETKVEIELLKELMEKGVEK